MATVLILGATSDMAQALAELYAKKGDKLQLAARNPVSLAPIKSDLEIRFEGKVSTYAFDAMNFDSHDAFYASLDEKPDLVLCVFGYLGDQAKAIKNWNESLQIIQSNFTGAVSILNIIANDMEARKVGVIVGISSVAGERGRMSNYLYGSAKAGFTAYLSGLRNRLCKSGVHVLTVKPGFVNTKMTEGLPLPKPLTAQPQQVAKAIDNAVVKQKNTIYIFAKWRLIMYIIKSIPESIFKKLSL